VQGQNFLALLASVRMYLPEDQYIVTSALPPNWDVLQNLDLPRVAEYLDLLNLTTYDLQGPTFSPKSGHHAQLYSMAKDEPCAATAVQWLLGAGFPAKKVLLGVPVFGRGFAGVAGPGHKNRGAAGTSADGLFEYAALPPKGLKETVDKKVVAAQVVSAEVGFVTYDNPDTVKLKATFCRQKGLGVSHVGVDGEMFGGY
jgi:chitinase